MPTYLRLSLTLLPVSRACSILLFRFRFRLRLSFDRIVSESSCRTRGSEIVFDSIILILIEQSLPITESDTQLLQELRAQEARGRKV